VEWFCVVVTPAVLARLGLLEKMPASDDAGTLAKSGAQWGFNP
jgi:hypothetical protein